MSTLSQTDQAYAACLSLARNHYENFPVASVLLPRRLRRPIAAIYAFARNADDMADEGDFSQAQRLAGLQDYRQKLTAIQAGANADDPVFVALQDSISQFALPYQPLFDLLSAFEQDVNKKRYATFDELLDYCRRSANPVGRLLIQLVGQADAINKEQSDAICSALQLINFMQDLKIDYAKGRIYLPMDEMQAHGVDEQFIAQRRYNTVWRDFVTQQLQRIEAMMHFGAPLAKRLKGRLGWELRAIVAGGLTVIDKLKRQNQKGFLGQARLGPRDWVKILGKLF